MSKNLVDMKKVTMVLLIFIMLSAVCMIFLWGWKSIATNVLAFRFSLLDANYLAIFYISWLTMFTRVFGSESLYKM